MSLLSDILSETSQLSINDVNSKMPEIVAATNTYKTNLLTYLEDIHVRFIEKPKVYTALIQESCDLQNEIVNLKRSSEDLIKNELKDAGKQLVDHLQNLNETNAAIENILKVCTITKNLRSIEGYLNDDSYLECMKSIKNAEDFFERLSVDEREVIEEVEDNLNLQKVLLLNKLNLIYNENIVSEFGEDKSVIKIKSKNDVINQVFSTFYLNGSIPPFDDFTRCFWEHILVPVVDYTTKLEITSQDDFAVLSLHVLEKKKPNYTAVFTSLENIFNFLSDNLNLKIDDEITTIELIGRDIRDNLSELIIKHCLKDTIPSTSEELKKYTIVIDCTEKLEKTLKDLKIFAEDTASILEYAKNVDFLFTNKKCEEYVELSLKMMKKDLHEMVEVGVDQTPEDFTNTNFPKCQVSKSVIELLGLLEKILEQAKISSKVCADNYLLTIRKICKKYPTFVAEHHKKLLQSIPQQIALFYNNCTYLAYNIAIWNEYLIPESEEIKSFAKQRFDLYVQNQIKQIEETMKNAGLEHQTLEHIETNTEKCLRQCLRQQELLKTVWQKVLPYEIYNKCLGMILSALVNCLSSQIVKFEDISTEAASQLVELLKMIQTRGPKLFTDAKEITLYVHSWYKLNELVFVLNASLVDINDRWADGKGPLGMQFTPFELKQLIRALFQNTERRAAVLAKIH